MNKDHSIGGRFNAIIFEVRRIITAALPVVVAYLVVMVALTVALDMGYLSGVAEFAIDVASLLAVFVMLNVMIDNSGIAHDGRRGGFWTYIGISILSGVAIVLGLVLLIIPGLILLVRWAPVYGYALVDGEGVTESMGRSWDATRVHVWPILLALLVPTACVILALGILFGFELSANWDAALFSDDVAGVSLASSVAANFLAYLSTVLSSAIGLGIYALLEDSGAGVSGIFD